MQKISLSGSLPLAGRAGEGDHSLMYRGQEQRDFARDLRNHATLAETRLWHFLRAGKLGVKFRRQAAIGAYIVDFVCFSHSLIVELDGPQHVEDKGREHDARRTAWLASRGFRVIRFRNQALDEDIWLVVEEIKRALRQPPSPALPAEGREQDKV
jgi:very-short-patch-repair endonuclease